MTLKKWISLMMKRESFWPPSKSIISSPKKEIKAQGALSILKGVGESETQEIAMGLKTL